MNQATTFRAGAAREVITPPTGIYLIGYGDRTKGNIGVHDDLTATALVLSGVSSREEAEAWTPVMDVIADDLSTLIELLKA